MPQLQITTQQRLPSGQIGAVRANPNLNDPISQADALQGAALKKVGKAVTKTADAIQEFREKKQKLVDNRIRSEGERTSNTAFTEFGDSLKTRNDPENFVNEFDALAQEKKNEILSNPNLSPEAKLTLTEILDDKIALHRIDVGRISSKKEHTMANVELNLAQDGLIAAGDFDGALANIQDGFTDGVIGPDELVKRTKALPQKIEVSNAKKELGADPGNADEILAKYNLNNDNFRELSRWATNKFAHEKSTNRVDHFTEQDRILQQNDISTIDLIAFQEEAAVKVEKKYITEKEARESADLISAESKNIRVDDQETIMLTIENMLIDDPEASNEKTDKLLGFINQSDLISLKSKRRFTALKGKVSKLHSANEKKADRQAAEADTKEEKILAQGTKYLGELEKSNMFGNRTIDKNGLDTTDKEFRKNLDLVKPAKGILGFGALGGRTQEQADEINNAIRDEKIKQRKLDNRERNETYAFMRLLVKTRPDITILQLKAEIDASLAGPAAQKALRDNFP